MAVEPVLRSVVAVVERAKPDQRVLDLHPVGAPVDAGRRVVHRGHEDVQPLNLVSSITPLFMLSFWTQSSWMYPDAPLAPSMRSPVTDQLVAVELNSMPSPWLEMRVPTIWMLGVSTSKPVTRCQVLHGVASGSRPLVIVPPTRQRLSLEPTGLWNFTPTPKPSESSGRRRTCGCGRRPWCDRPGGAGCSASGCPGWPAPGIAHTKDLAAGAG